MNQADAFVQAILDDPDDDSLRLIYADWLEERGDPRGEFIRVQFALAGMDADDPRRSPLEARERTLLKEHGAVWAEPLPQLVGEYAFGHGFVENVTLDARGFLERGPELFRLAPVQTVRLNGGSVHLASLANAPHLARVRGLDLRFLRFSYSGEPNGQNLGSLLNSLYLDRLACLDLTSDYIGDAGAALLAASPRMAGVTALHLAFNNIGIAGILSLARSTNFARLATLDLSGNPLGHPWVHAIGGSLFPALSDLNLSGTDVRNVGVQELAKSPHVAGIEKLDLRFNKISDTGVEALAAAPTLGKLRVLKLGYNPFGTPGVRALAASPHMAQLTALDLRRARVANNAAQALIESPYLGQLHRLDLRGNDISQRRCEALRERFGAAVCLT
jgi:uncharacterized protein (TIGR02996 family)